LPVRCEGQALLAVRRLIGDVADLPEGPGVIVRGVAVVFNDEKAQSVRFGCGPL
jgi:hypothetical protein